MSQIVIYAAVIGSCWGFARFVADVIGTFIWAYHRWVVKIDRRQA